MGQYIAETIEQAEPYAEQLHGRGVLCLRHAARLRSAARVGAGIVAAEHQGDGTLWGRRTPYLDTATETDAANAIEAFAEAEP